MTGEHPDEAEPSAGEADARRRRRERVFGETLPDTTSDERDEGRADGGHDAWLKQNVPPHHGD